VKGKTFDSFDQLQMEIKKRLHWQNLPDFNSFETWKKQNGDKTMRGIQFFFTPELNFFSSN
jgi:hypothetical protein